MEPWLTQAGTLTGAGLCSFAAWRAALGLRTFWLTSQRKREEFTASLREFERELEQNSLASAPTEIEGDWKGYRRFRIERIASESKQIKSFTLVPEDGCAIARFQPGSYLTLRLTIPGESQPLVRCYSLSSRPMGDRYRISVKREEHGKMSRLLHDSPLGTIVEVQSPRGEFTPILADTRPLVLIGCGIGITPLLSMADTLLHGGGSRPIVLFYGVRNREEHAFREEIARLAQTHSRFHPITCYSRPEASDNKRIDYDYAGRIEVPFILQSLGSIDFPFYVCGPSAFMESMVTGLLAAGVASEDLHFEAFGPSSLTKPEKPRSNAGPTKPIARVSFIRSGLATLVTASETTILEAAEEAGANVPAGCRAGNCGSCAVRLSAGEIAYRKRPTAEIPSGHCLACVAVPKSDDVTIDA